MKYDVRYRNESDPHRVFVVLPGDYVVDWNFHQDLHLGERYVVTLERQRDCWRVIDVEKPERFTEAVHGMEFELQPGESLVTVGELNGFRIDDRLRIATLSKS